MVRTSKGATTVTVDAGTGFAVGDIIEFGDASANFNVAPSGEFYKVTAINTHVLTIARVNPSNPNGLSVGQTGLKDDVVDNVRIKRRWEYYYLFDGGFQEHLNMQLTMVEQTMRIHLVVVDEDGGITGVGRGGFILEKYEGLSQGSDVKNAQGGTNYYVDVLYNQSEYIYWMDHESTLANAGASVVGQTFDNEGSSGSAVFKASLSGGTSDNVPTNGELELAYDKFDDAESVDVNFIIGGSSQTGADATGDTKATMLIDLAEARKDCVAFISPARADVVNVTDPVTQTENVAVSLMD